MNLSFEWIALLATSAMYWGLGQVVGVAKTRVAGTAWNRSNRETDPPVPPWVERTEKAQRNLLESLPLFASLVIVTTFAQKLGVLSSWGAAIFLLGRVAHAAFFMQGVTGWRTGAYLLSLVGMGLMLAGLVL